MKKLLLLGSVVSPCPAKKQGGTERVAYYQAKHLAKRDIQIIFVGAKQTKKNFAEQLDFEKETRKEKILSNIDFVEIGGGTGTGNQEDAVKIDPSQMESSRKFRMEMVHLAKVQELMIQKQSEYDVILNNMRGEALFLPLAKKLQKRFINIMHLNIFPELAELFQECQTDIITISNAQRQNYPNLNYLATIYNPVNTDIYTFSNTQKNYALMVGTVGMHKNQQDAVLACQKAGIPLVITGKIRDEKYFEKEIKSHVDNKSLTYFGEIDFEKKLKLYQEAKVFLFPINWQEPFGLVVIEALACGTPIIAYPHGGPKEIVVEGKTGFLVESPDQMAEAINKINNINRRACREDAEKRFADNVIGEQYFNFVSKVMKSI